MENNRESNRNYKEVLTAVSLAVIGYIIISLMSCGSSRGHSCSKANKNYWHNQHANF